MRVLFDFGLDGVFLQNLLRFRVDLTLLLAFLVNVNALAGFATVTAGGDQISEYARFGTSKTLPKHLVQMHLNVRGDVETNFIGKRCSSDRESDEVPALLRTEDEILDAGDETLLPADTPFGQVKIGELPAWLSRRSLNPVAMSRAASRGYWRWFHKYVAMRYGTAAPYVQFAVGLSALFYCINYKSIRLHSQAKYH
ncbi:putative ATP synthase subunit f, mitochondrial [Hypsibius exemplaris]|uniref:ATP synthase subunit f, mitochondrial n=1 Tax=Hypsibius exemplaris TaxID=2072580 RepID=A0A9X6NC31_HYPEX|nr:putative ATP synthase subunit f, mitochondrial [Hypsibius exemplaris]